MRRIKALLVEFEALGVERIAYTQSMDLEYILETIKVINPTAHLRRTEKVTVDAKVFDKNNIELIKSAHLRYENEYKNK